MRPNMYGGKRSTREAKRTRNSFWGGSTIGAAIDGASMLGFSIADCGSASAVDGLAAEAIAGSLADGVGAPSMTMEGRCELESDEEGAWLMSHPLGGNRGAASPRWTFGDRKRCAEPIGGSRLAFNIKIVFEAERIGQTIFLFSRTPRATFDHACSRTISTLNPLRDIRRGCSAASRWRRCDAAEVRILGRRPPHRFDRGSGSRVRGDTNGRWRFGGIGRRWVAAANPTVG